VLANTNHQRKLQAGFTIPELMISITLIGIISIGIFAAIIYYFANMTRNNIFAEMSVSSQNFLRTTVEELRYGAGVRQNNTITDSNEPIGGWDTSNDSFVIIIAVPAKDSNQDYIINPSTNEPYNNELVYFRQGNTLYKRTLADPDATGNTLKTSCPASLASSSCPADRKLLENLNTIQFTLYDQDDVEINDPLLARSIEIDLNVRSDSFGQPQSLDNSIRTTLRNQF